MFDQLKKVNIVLGIVFILIVLYGGSYLPYEKSRLAKGLIIQLGPTGGATSIRVVSQGALKYQSPVGQEEMVQKFTESLTKLLSKIDAKSVSEVPDVMTYVEDINKPIIDRGRGLNFVGHLLSLGDINYIAWLKTGSVGYALQAEKYYNECLEKSPARPQCLYGLFNLYLSDANRLIDVRQTGGEILSYWPNDDLVRQIVSDINGSKDKEEANWP